MKLGKAILVLGVLICAAPAGWIRPASADSGLDGKEDFGNILNTGGRYHVAGAFPTLIEDLDGGPENSYPWGMGWDAGTGTLWVGTVRNLLCLLTGGFGDPSCPAPPGGAAFALPVYPRDAAQIWAYTPAGVGGLDGTWEMKYQSGTIPALWQTLLELSGSATEPVPRVFGYRNVLIADVADDAPDLGPVPYFGSLGLPGGIFWWNDTTDTLVEASTTGLPGLGLVDLIGGSLNLGFRALEFFDGHVCTYPAASLTDTDTTDFPQVFCSSNPISGSWEAWSTEGWGDPDVIGSFDAATVDNTGDGVADYLCFSSYDRVKGSTIYCTDGYGCDVDVEAPAGVMDCDWNPTDTPGPGTDKTPTPLVANGMGRPVFYAGFETAGPSHDAAGFGMGTYDEQVAVVGPSQLAVEGDGKDDYLYFGMADAAAGPEANNLLAEMGRIDFRTDVPVAPLVGGPAQLAPNPDFLKWDFIAGLPRMTGDCATDSLSSDVGPFPLYRQKACTLVDLPAFFGGPTGSSCVCEPLSGRGLGMADTAYDFGPNAYLWRFLMHQGDFFVTSLHTGGGGGGGNPGGADLYKSADGIHFDRIVNDGFNGNSRNYGIRTMVTTDPTPYAPDPVGPSQLGIAESPILVAGVANPYGDVDAVVNGFEIWVGTTEPEASPIADAGPAQLVVDPDGTVKPTLDGTGSVDPFGGSIVGYSWLDDTAACAGAAAGGDSDSSDTDPIDLTITQDPFTSPFVQTFGFSLEVTDDGANTDCDTTTVYASKNQVPHVTLATDPPLVLESNFGGGRLRLRLVDFDGDGKEPFTLTVKCDDPDYPSLSAVPPICDKFQVDPEIVFPDPGLLADTAFDFTTPMMYVDIGRGDSTPDLQVEARDGVVCPTDAEPFCSSFDDSERLEVILLPFTDTPSVNDAPGCNGATYTMLAGTGTLTISPEADGLCMDPDGDTGLDYVAGAVAPAHGSSGLPAASPSFVYDPVDSYVGTDLFTYRAADGEPLESGDAGILVKVIDCTLPNDPPVVHLDVPETISATDTREACLSIDASGVVDGGTVEFLAGDVITFENGFTVESPAVFTATLDDSVYSLTPP